MEVFMLRRNLQSEFVGGAYVFPGGAVDDDDRDPTVERVCVGRTDAEASKALEVDHGGLAYWLAAVRECFEEAGVLLARAEDGHYVSFGGEGVAARFELHRAAVDSGQRRLVDVCEEENLHLAVDAIFYWSHWITPLGPPRRYDTRFFVCAAPAEQVPLHDDREAIAHTWIRPADALDRHARGEFMMIFPTIKNLEAVARFPTASALLDAASLEGEIPAILPMLRAGPGGALEMVLPGDPDYDPHSAARGR